MSSNTNQETQTPPHQNTNNNTTTVTTASPSEIDQHQNNNNTSQTNRFPTKTSNTTIGDRKSILIQKVNNNNTSPPVVSSTSTTSTSINNNNNNNSNNISLESNCINSNNNCSSGSIKLNDEGSSTSSSSLDSGSSANNVDNRLASPNVKLLGKVFDSSADKHIQQQKILNRCSPPPSNKPNFVIVKKEKQWMSQSGSSVPTTNTSSTSSSSSSSASASPMSNSLDLNSISSIINTLNNNISNGNSNPSSPKTSPTPSRLKLSFESHTQINIQQQQQKDQIITKVEEINNNNINNNISSESETGIDKINNNSNKSTSPNSSTTWVPSPSNTSPNTISPLPSPPTRIRNNHRLSGRVLPAPINNSNNEECNNNNSNFIISNKNDTDSTPTSSPDSSEIMTPPPVQSQQQQQQQPSEIDNKEIVQTTNKEEKLDDESLQSQQQNFSARRNYQSRRIAGDWKDKQFTQGTTANLNLKERKNLIGSRDPLLSPKEKDNTTNNNIIINNNIINTTINNNNTNTNNNNNNNNNNKQSDSEDEVAVKSLINRYQLRRDNASRKSKLSTQDVEWITTKFIESSPKETTVNTPEKKDLTKQQQQQQQPQSPLQPSQPSHTPSKSSPLLKTKYLGTSVTSGLTKKTRTNKKSANGSGGVDSSGEEDDIEASNPNNSPCYRFLEDVATRHNIPSEPSRKPGLKSPLFLHVPTLAQPTQFHQNAPEKLNSNSLSISVEENSHQDQSLLFNQQIINRVAHDKDLTYLFFPVLKSSTKIASISSTHHHNALIKQNIAMNAAKQGNSGNGSGNSGNSGSSGNNSSGNNSGGSGSSNSSGVNVSSCDSYISLSPSMSPCSSLTPSPSQASPPSSSASSPIESLSLPMSPNTHPMTPRSGGVTSDNRKSYWSPKLNTNSNNSGNVNNSKSPSNSPLSDNTMSPSLSPSSPQEYLSATVPSTLVLSSDNTTDESSTTTTSNNIEEEFKSRDDIYFVTQPIKNFNKFSRIKCGSIDALVEVLTHHKISEPNFVDTFLLTHKTFTTSQTLLTKLIERYEEEPPALDENATPEQIDNQSKIYRSIKLRVCSILKIWIDKHFYDFEKDPQLLKDFENFIKVTLVEDGMEKISQNIQRNINRKLTGDNFDKNFLMNKVPPPIIPTLKHDQIVTLFTLDDLEIARQLTLIEHEAYSLIKPNECINLAFSKPGKEDNAPNITGIIRRSNIIPLWVATEIVQEERLTKRANIIKKFINIADHCRNLNNFNGVMEILSGLNITPVFRLKKTWETIPRKYLATFRHLNSLMAPKHNFKVYRDVLHTKNPPCLPFLGVYLTDLTFLEEGSPDTLEGGLINMVKRTQLAAVIQEIQQFQQMPYSLQPVPIIKEFLHQVNGLQERALYKQSRIVEP